MAGNQSKSNAHQDFYHSLATGLARLGPGSVPRWALALAQVLWWRLVAGAPCDRVAKTTNGWLAFSEFFLFEGETHDQQTILSNLSNSDSDLFFR